MKILVLAAVAAVLSTAAAAQEQSPPDPNFRQICSGQTCRLVPYLNAVLPKSMPLPEAVERAFERGYVLIEFALKTTSGIIERGSCGGFIVDARERLVITAQHCLPPYATLVDGKNMWVEGIAVKYLTSLGEADLALLQLERLPPGKDALPYKEAVVQETIFGRSIHLFPFTDVPSSKTVSDQSMFFGPVTFYGTLLAKGQIRVHNYTSARDGQGPTSDLVATDLEALRIQPTGGTGEPGFSGSPLYNLWGEVVGIVSGGTPGQTLMAGSAKNFPKLIEKYKKSKQRS